MPLGPQDAEHSDPFAGSPSLEYRFPVTGGAPGTVTSSSERNGVSSDISDDLGLSDNTQGDYAPSEETLDGQHAAAILNSEVENQSVTLRKGFTAAEVAEGLQVSQQEQSSFPRTRVESLVEPVSAQGALDPVDTSVHSDVANEVPVLNEIGVVVRDNDPMNDMVNSDPYYGREESPFTNPAAPTGLEASSVWLGMDGKYRITFNWDNAAAADEVVAWELWEANENGDYGVILVPYDYPWTNTTPNRLLDAAFITASNEDVNLDRVSNGTFSFKVRAISSTGRYSELSDPVSVNLFPAPATVTLLAGGTASWTAVADIGSVGYQYQIDNNGTPGLVWVANADTDVAGLNLAAFAGGGTAYIHVRVAGSPRFATDTVVVP